MGLDGLEEAARGLPAIRFHDLRHTFATLQLAAGTNPKTVSEVLGHKEVAITPDGYSHPLPTLYTKTMARLDAMLGRGADAAPRTSGDKGSNKGSLTGFEANEGPDPSVDRAEAGEFDTAYRIPGEVSHASQPRSRSTTKRRMRQEP